MHLAPPRLPERLSLGWFWDAWMAKAELYAYSEDKRWERESIKVLREIVKHQKGAPPLPKHRKAILEAGAALLSPGGDKVRLVGGRGSGRPRFYEIDLLQPPAAPIPSDSVLLSRDWSRILGMRLNEQGEVVPIPH